MIERLTGLFFPRPLDTTDIALGEVDWIGGFSDKGCKELEAFVTPVLRCLGETPHTRKRYCAAIARTRGVPLKRNIPLTSTESVVPGAVIPLHKGHKPFHVPEHTSVFDSREAIQSCAVDVSLTDDSSTTLPYADLQRHRPDVAYALSRWMPCPPSVSFFIQDNGNRTLAIPTASILQACYAPSLLSKHLSDNVIASSFASDSNFFDGFSYGKPRHCFPMRSLKHLHRAEHEVAQILPRATAYYRRHGRFLPLLLRPPFTGAVTVAGPGVEITSGGRKIIAFTSWITFYSKSATALRENIAYHRQNRDFAPHLYRVTALKGAGIGLSWSGREYGVDEFYDVHMFPAISSAVEESLRQHELIDGPEVVYDVAAIMRYRNWCARHMFR